jgi:hypothetical protein
MSHRAAPARSLVLAGAVLLAALAGCSDDDGDSADRSTTTTSPADAPTTTAAGSGKPLNESDLIDALLDPAEVAEGLKASPLPGSGDLELELCPDVTLEATWDDQAAQGLIRSGSQDLLVVNQSVLAFADAAAAEAFYDAVVDGYAECDPGLASEAVPDVGDEAVLLGAAAGGEGTSSVALVRAGAHVVRLDANGTPPVPGAEPVVSAELAARLAAVLPPP